MAAAKLYFAGPLFTAAERDWNAGCARRLGEDLGCEILLPQAFCAPFEQHGHDHGVGADYGQVFAACREHLDRADAVLAVLDGADADSGTAWEIGYAFARSIPVIGLRTDWRPSEDGGANCMLTRSCREVVCSLDHAVARLREVLG